MKRFCLLSALLVVLSAFAQVPQINLVLVHTGFMKPTEIANCGDGRIFIVEQNGYIQIMDKQGNVNATPFLDIDAKVLSAGNEQGLLGLAFSPNYKQDGFFYANYITGTSGGGTTRISRFSVNPTDSNLADPNSEKILHSFSQPYTNHKGGSLKFGPDGYLYDSQGDGGSQDDPSGNGQNKNVNLAKILRLDVSNPDTTYMVPASNPFVGVPNTNKLVWAYGLRNPWRTSFDRLTGDYWIADVGQDYFEEINFEPRGFVGGRNYGWRCREGNGYCSTCDTTGCSAISSVLPTFQYAHALYSSCSVTGGYVYRGAQYSKLFGLFIFTDYCSGRFFSIKQTSPGVFDTDTLQDFTNNQFTTFGEDNNGELYVAYRGSTTSATGRIYKVTETGSCNPVAFITFDDTIVNCSPYTITALKGDSLSYQWYNSSGLINGATSYQHQVTQTGWYKVEVSKAQLGCQAMSDSVYVSLTTGPTLTPNITPNKFCRGDAPQSLVGYVAPAGGVFAGSGINANTFNPNAVSSGGHTITYTYTDTAGCVAQYSFSLQVNDTAFVGFSGTDTAFCIDEPASSLDGLFFPQGGIFAGNGVNNDTLFTPSVAGAGAAVVGYTYTTVAGCMSHINQIMEVGDKSQLVENIPSGPYCDNGNAVSLSGFVSPLGGTYSGNGVVFEHLNPALVDTGLNDVYYTYTNQYGCVSMDTFQVLVVACTGINDVSGGLGIKVFPNPNKGEFNLTITSLTSQSVVISIADITGKLVWKKKQKLSVGNAVVDVPQLSKGIYQLIVKGENGSATHKVVVQQ